MIHTQLVDLLVIRGLRASQSVGIYLKSNYSEHHCHCCKTYIHYQINKESNLFLIKPHLK